MANQENTDLTMAAIVTLTGCTEEMAAHVIAIRPGKPEMQIGLVQLKMKDLAIKADRLARESAAVVVQSSICSKGHLPIELVGKICPICVKRVHRKTWADD